MSSYSLTWTAMAHLMQEGFYLVDPSRLAGQLPGSLHLLPPYHLLPALPCSPDLDLGALLCGYLRRFSPSCLDTRTEAVSVLQVLPSGRLCPLQHSPGCCWRFHVECLRKG